MKKSQKKPTKSEPAVKASTDAADLLVGKAVIIRTVTHYYTGRVRSFEDGLIVLSEAAWIADTGRWADALKTGALKEIEPYPDICIVSAGAVIDISPWPHALPRETK